VDLAAVEAERWLDLAEETHSALAVSQRSLVTYAQLPFEVAKKARRDLPKATKLAEVATVRLLGTHQVEWPPAPFAEALGAPVRLLPCWKAKLLEWLRPGDRQERQAIGAVAQLASLQTLLWK